MKWLLVWLAFLPVAGYAQFSLSGSVVNLLDKKPVPKASVYLGNTTAGTATADDGTYTLSSVKQGQYTLIVSAIGFETAHQTVTIDKTLTLPDIELVPKSISLKEVVIKPDPDWERNYNVFKDELLGRSTYAAQCRIVNPEVLSFDYNTHNRTLTATASDALQIENKALGYTLRFGLRTFNKDYAKGYFYYESDVLFRDMEGTPRQRRRWHKNRLDAFKGSSEHFFRCCINNTLEKEGFKVLKLIRGSNPQRQPDTLIQAKLKQFRIAALHNTISDSLAYWGGQSNLPKTVSYLLKEPQKLQTFFNVTQLNGIYQLAFSDYLYVMYTRKQSSDMNVYRPNGAANNLTTILHLTAPDVLLDNNGIIINPSGIIYEGDWGFDRVAKLLPINYDPNAAP